jgi:hypothetical protein
VVEQKSGKSDRVNPLVSSPSKPLLDVDPIPLSLLPLLLAKWFFPYKGSLQRTAIIERRQGGEEEDKDVEEEEQGEDATGEGAVFRCVRTIPPFISPFRWQLISPPPSKSEGTTL